MGLEVESPSCPPSGPVLQPPSAEDGATQLACRAERTNAGVQMGSRLRNQPEASGSRPGGSVVATLQLSNVIGGQGDGVATRQRQRERTSAASSSGAGLGDSEGAVTRGAGGGVAAVMSTDGPEGLDVQTRTRGGRRKVEESEGGGLTPRTQAKRRRRGEDSSACARNLRADGAEKEQKRDSPGRGEGALQVGGLGAAVGAEATDDATSARDVAGVPATGDISDALSGRVVGRGEGGGGNDEIRGTEVLNGHEGALMGYQEGEGEQEDVAGRGEERTSAAAAASAAVEAAGATAAPVASTAGEEGGTDDDAARVAQVLMSTPLPCPPHAHVTRHMHFVVYGRCCWGVNVGLQV